MIRIELGTPGHICLYIGRLEIRKHNIGNTWRDWRQFLPGVGKWWMWFYIPILFNAKTHERRYWFLQGWKGIGIGIGDGK